MRKDRDISSKEKGMLQIGKSVSNIFKFFFFFVFDSVHLSFKLKYLESTSSKNELFGMLIESSAISARILPITCIPKVSDEFLGNNYLLLYIK